MKMVPLFYVDDMIAALAFYTDTLDFELADWDTSEDVVVSLFRGDVELMLTRLRGDQVSQVHAIMLVEEADKLFAHWTSRGLDQSDRGASPVHRAPLDQTWGTREFYVSDPGGNTLRIVQRPRG